MRLAMLSFTAMAKLNTLTTRPRATHAHDGIVRKAVYDEVKVAFE
jgi:hypothetical protein